MEKGICFWRSGKQVNIIVLCALAYAALLIPFKGFHLIPDIEEVRVAAFIPIVFGIVFGPAGAIGSALGNVIADLFGTWSFSSIFGMFGSFLTSYVAYRYWAFIFKANKQESLLCFNGFKHFYFYMKTALLGTLSGTLITALGVEIFGYAPFLGTFFTILISHLLFNLIFGWWAVIGLIHFSENFELAWNVPNAMTPYPNFMMLALWWADHLIPKAVVCVSSLSVLVAFVRGQKILDAHFNGEMDMLVIINGIILFATLIGTLFSGREFDQAGIESLSREPQEQFRE